MALRQILSKREVLLDARGSPLGAGFVYFYEPNTTTPISVYGDSGAETQITNPVRLSGSGRAEAWVLRDCDVLITDKDGKQIANELNQNPDALGTDETGGLVPNGSFEVDGDSDTVPDGWTHTPETGSSNAIDTSTSTDGGQSFRFTGTGSGGGTLETTDFFPVNDVDDLRVYFDLIASIATVRNIVRVAWYDVSTVFISNTDVYDSTANPTTWTSKQLIASPPLNARFAKLLIIGCEVAGSTGSTWFDRVSVFYPALVAGVFDNITIQSNEIISTNTNGLIELKPNGTGLVSLEYNTAVRLRTTPTGIEVRSQTSTDAEDRLLELNHQDGTIRGRLGFIADGLLRIRNQVHGAAVQIEAEDVGGTLRSVLVGDPDGELTAYYAGTERLLTRGGGVVSLQSDTSTDLENRYLSLEHQDGTARGRLGYVGSGLLRLRNEVHGENVQLEAEDALGTLQTLLAGDPDGAVTAYYDGTAVLRTALSASGGAEVFVGAAWNRLLSVADEGAGNGLDADTVDGSHASAFAAASHSHAAADISSGTFADARIAQSNVTQHQAALAIDAGQTTTGIFAAARIPSLDASKIATGAFADARIAQTNVTQHQAALALAATQLTSGSLPDARVVASNVTQHQASINHDALSNFVANEHRLITVSTAGPSGGADGDVWLTYI